MRKPIGLLFVVLGAVAVLLSSCGGSDEESQAAPISKAAFVKQANAVCEKASEKILAEASAAQASSKPTSLQERAKYVPTILVPEIEQEIEEVRALGLPKGDEAKVEAFLEELQKVMDKAKANPQKFLQVLGNGLRPYQDAEKLANEYGIPACSQP